MTEKRVIDEILNGDQKVWKKYLDDDSMIVKGYAIDRFAEKADLDAQLNQLRTENQQLCIAMANQSPHSKIRMELINLYPKDDEIVSAVINCGDQECIKYIVNHAENFNFGSVYAAVKKGGRQYIDTLLRAGNEEMYNIAAVLGNEDQIKEFIMQSPPDNIYMAFAELNLTQLQQQREVKSGVNYSSYQEKLSELFNKISTGLRTVFQKDQYINFLNEVAKHPQMSISNQVLLFESGQTGTEYKTFDEWKREGVSVHHGADGVELITSDGQHYGIKTVIDVSQTDKRDHSHNHPIQLKQLIQAMKESTPYTIEENNIDQVSELRFRGKIILINERLPDERKAQAIIKEICRSMNHGHYDLYTRTTEYLLCKKYGVDTTHIRLDSEGVFALTCDTYLASVYQIKLSKIKSDLELSIKNAGKLIVAVDRQLEEVRQGKNKMNGRKVPQNQNITERLILAGRKANMRNKALHKSRAAREKSTEKRNQ